MSGLEILGAVASSVALVQAVKGTIKAVNLLREVGEIQQQCDELEKEVAMIDACIQLAKRQAGPSSPSSRLAGAPQEHCLVTCTVRELQLIQKELEQISAKYVNDPSRVQRKIQWVFGARRKLEELRRKAHETKSDLNTAINFRSLVTVEEVGIRQEMHFQLLAQQLVSCLQETQIGFANVSRILEGPRRPSPPLTTPHGTHDAVEEGETEQAEATTGRITDQDVPGNTTEEPNTQSQMQTEMQGLSVTDGPEGHSSVSIRQESLVTVTAIRPLGSRACGLDCQCRCHWSERQYSGGAWAQPLLGSWLVRSRGIEGFGKMKCTERDCDPGNNTGVKFEYRLPKWLWAGMLCFQAYQGQGPGLTLRPSRTIEGSDPVWSWIMRPSILRKKIREGLAWFPDDSSAWGENLTQRVIYHGQHESLAILLEWWHNVLPVQGLPRSVGYQIFYRCPSSTDGEVGFLLEKTRGFIQDVEMMQSTRVHSAVWHGGLLQALEEQPWAINELDDYGRTPITGELRFTSL